MKKFLRDTLPVPFSMNFAAGCSREVIERGAAMLGWELDELIRRTIEAMKSLLGELDI